MSNNTAINADDQLFTSNRSHFFNGAKYAVPIAVGYIPIAIAFGILSKSSNIPNYISILMSLTVYAGAAQFMAANLIGAGTSSLEIILAVFILNLRHFLMTASISQKVEKNLTGRWMALLAFGITDETFAVASLRDEQNLNRYFMLGLNILSYSAWVGGTAVGVFLGSSLPVSLSSSMGIALYSMFIGLLVPSLKKSRPILIVACISVIFHSILRLTPGISNLSSGWSIIIATIAASITGALFFPKGVNANE